MPRLDKFLKSDAGGSDMLVLNSKNEIQKIITGGRESLKSAAEDSYMRTL